MSGSARPPLTSLSIDAPTSRARAATVARIVSIETVAPASTRAATTGMTRRSSSATLGPFCPRAGGLTADIDEVSTLGEQLAAVVDGRIGGEPLATVAERVGGDVDDPHDQRPAHRPPPVCVMSRVRTTVAGARR